MSLTGSASMTNELQGSVESGGEVRGKLAGLRFIQGLSAYEVAVLEGFSGTEAEWLETLKGKGIESIAEIESGQFVDGDRVTSRWTDYRITFTDGKTMDYRVYGGADGKRGERGASITNIFLREVTEEGNVYNVQVGMDLFTFTAPKGEPGVPGERGEPGKDGTMSFDELTDAQKESLRGGKGDKGDPGVSGVYVGSGDMPEGYNVQVDPNGEDYVLEIPPAPKLMTAEEFDAVTDWNTVLGEGEIAWRCG